MPLCRAVPCRACDACSDCVGASATMLLARATGAPLADRGRVFATLRSQAIRLNYKSTESSVCLSYGIAVAKTDPHTAVRSCVLLCGKQLASLSAMFRHRITQVSLFQDGLIAMSQVTKVTAATKQVKKSLVENLVKTKSALGPYKKPSTPSASGDCANLKCGLSNSFVMVCPEMVPDDDRDNCTLCHLQFTMFTRRRVRVGWDSSIYRLC